MASVGKGALCPGFAASIPGTGNQGDLLPTSPLETLKLLRLLTPLYTAVEGARSRRVKVGQFFLHVVQDPHGIILLAGLNSVATTDF